MPRNEILIRLKSIEEKLDKGERRARWQWMYGLGIVLMIASLTLLPAPSTLSPIDIGGSVALFIAGLLLMFFALYKK